MKKTYLKNPWIVFLLVFIVVLAFVPRFFLLNNLLTADEASSAISPFSAIVTTYLNSTNHIFHELLTNGLMSLFGVNHLTLRGISLLSGLLLVPLAYAFATELFNSYSGILTSLLVATSFPLIDVSTEAVGYSLFVLICTACYLTTLKLIRNESRILWLTLCILVSLGTYTIPIMVYPAGVCFGWYLVHKMSRTPQEYWRTVKHVVIYTLVCITLTSTLFLPVFLNNSFQLMTNNHDIQPQNHSTMLENNISLGFDTLHYWTGGYSITLLIVGLTSLIGIIAFSNHTTEVITLLSGSTLWLTIIFIFYPVVLYKSRFLIFLIPLLFVLISGGLVSLIEYFLIEYKSIPTLIIIFGLCFFSIMSQYNNYLKELHKPDMNNGYQFVRRLLELADGENHPKQELKIINPYTDVRIEYFLQRFVPAKFMTNDFQDGKLNIVTVSTKRPFQHVTHRMDDQAKYILSHEKHYQNTLGKIYLIKLGRPDQTKQSRWSL